MYEFYTKDNSRLINIKTYKHDSDWKKDLPEKVKNWLEISQFEKHGYAMMQGDDGELAAVYLLVEKGVNEIERVTNLVYKLPSYYTYCFQGISGSTYEYYALHWGLQSYQFCKFKESSKTAAKLYLTEDVNEIRMCSVLSGIFLVRDLINRPTEDLNTKQFSEVIEEICSEQGAKFRQVVGDKLLKENYPAIHAVGRASSHEPRLCHFEWGDKTHKKLTLVGKGVCFDSGGLSIKPSNAMVLMKKDMGGAAHALGLAQMIMKLKLPVYLNVYLPLVENAISANAIRPGDVIPSRKGLSVEVTNTDAEGRLILSDALTEACEHSPDLLIDFATLTGAARVAVGTEVAAFFTKNNSMARKLMDKGDELEDYVWQLPLHQPYKKLIQSNIADIDNSGKSPFAGATTAALFLNHFVEDSINWIHFDMMAYNVSARPGHPEGGEAQGLRTILNYIENEFVVYE